jgi:carboxylesterase type B
MYRGSGGNVSAWLYGEQCAQGNSGSEDCLFLNIWTPYLPRDPTAGAGLKPVMFWIHGGAFTGGSANDATFDGGNIAYRGDVVMVAVNYRLATLGFLALNDGITNGNYGLADQILALDWVRENIRNFGGDPERITIFGQSAGAGSVRAMMASPRALGKFAGAVPASNLGGFGYGATYSKYYTIDEEMEVVGNAILTATNCATATSRVECLRALNVTELSNIGEPARFIVVDGTFITTPQLELKGSRLPFNLMMGTTAEDGAPFLTYIPDMTVAENATWLASQGLPPLPAGVYPLQSVANETLVIDRLAGRYATDAMFRCVDQATVFAGLESGVFGERVWYYEFDRAYQTQGWPALNLCEPPSTASHPNGDPQSPEGYLKCHSGELLYMFGNLAYLNRPLRDDRDLPFEQYSIDLFTSFVRTFDPNPDPAYLAARGYNSTLDLISRSGPWLPSVKGTMQTRILDWPGAPSVDFPGSADGGMMSGFRDVEQCEWMNLGLRQFL